MVLGYFETGQIDEAKAQAAELLRLNPKLTAGNNQFVKQLKLDKDFQARALKAFQAAGFP